jgi:hypothetical protein
MCLVNVVWLVVIVRNIRESKTASKFLPDNLRIVAAVSPEFSQTVRGYVE